jgi:hypothetical protein
VGHTRATHGDMIAMVITDRLPMHHRNPSLLVQTVNTEYKRNAAERERILERPPHALGRVQFGRIRRLNHARDIR